MCNVISHAHIDAIVVEGASEGTIVVAAQDPAEDHHQHLVEEEASQDANITPVSYTTDQGKPQCIPPIILSLSHSYLHHMFVHLSS